MDTEAKSTTRILIVDDDAGIRDLLTQFLRKQLYFVDAARDALQADKFLSIKPYDIVILDLMLPGEDGLSVCRRIRATSNIPIIMLTALSEETDRIVGLEIGADDYLPKPFNPRELLARIKAVLRRYSSHPKHPLDGKNFSLIKFEGWTLNLSKRELRTADDILVSLTSGEFNLLLAFVENPQKVLNRDQLLDITKGRNAGPFDRSVDVQLSRLRKKIEADPKEPNIIKTVRSGGYIFSCSIEAFA